MDKEQEIKLWNKYQKNKYSMKVMNKICLMAFSAENKLSLDFDWNQYYGRGFNALNFKVLHSVFTDEENK